MAVRQDVIRVDLAVYFDNWTLELSEGTEPMFSIVYVAEVTAMDMTEAVRKCRETLGEHLAGLKILRTAVTSIMKVGEVYV